MLVTYSRDKNFGDIFDGMMTEHKLITYPDINKLFKIKGKAIFRTAIIGHDEQMNSIVGLDRIYFVCSDWCSY